MSSRPYVLTIRGARGSTPTSGRNIVRYGGNTTCLEVALAPNRRLILDCGSGLRSLHEDLPRDPPPEGREFHVFLTHYHWDHLEGLPFFPPIYDRRSTFVFHGFVHEATDVRSALEGALRPPWFPMSLGETASVKSYVNLGVDTLAVEELQVIPVLLHHPQGIAGYRLEHDGHSVVLATDTERGDPVADAALSALAHRADVLIHDAQYTPDEYAAKHGWGHSTWEHAVAAARDAEVRRLLLFHHDPERSDDEVDALVEAAREEFPEVEGAREGMTLSL